MGAVFIYLPVGIAAVIGFACGVGYVIRENRRSKKRRRARDLAIADLAQQQGITLYEARKIIEND